MLQAWKKKNVTFFDSEDLFFPQNYYHFTWQHVKKNSAGNKSGKNFFSALCEQTDFFYVTVIFRIVNRRISSVDMMTVLWCINLG